MRSCIKSGIADHWKVELDVRDLGGHLGTTLRGQAVLWLVAVGALPLGFKVKLPMLRLNRPFGSAWRWNFPYY